MELDKEEYEATRKLKQKKCEYCNLVSGEEKDLGRGTQQLIIERHNNTFLLVSKPYYEIDEEVEISYCPMCGRKLVEIYGK